MYFDMHPLLIARAAMAASRKSNNNCIEADLWITGTADMEGVPLEDDRVAQARYWLQVEAGGTFIVLFSRYARGGFSAMSAAEEALKTDLWGPADDQGKRSGNGARAYGAMRLLVLAPNSGLTAAEWVKQNMPGDFTGWLKAHTAAEAAELMHRAANLCTNPEAFDAARALAAGEAA